MARRVERQEPTISFVAASYEATCSCDEDEIIAGIQIYNLERTPEGDGWIFECPNCKYRHTFDLNEVEHASG